MAKIICAKCGAIFGLGSEPVQTCPVCGCRLRVKEKKPAAASLTEPAAPSPSVGSDEYDGLRREYGEYREIRDRSASEDVVRLPRAEYNELLLKASAHDAMQAEKDALPAERQAVPAAEPVVLPPPQDVSVPAAAPEPVPAPIPAYPQPQTAAPAPYAALPAAPAAPSARKKGTAIGWIAFAFALIAGGFSACLLMLECYPMATGLDLLMTSSWNMPFNLVVAFLLFLPAAFAVLTLISALLHGKASKIVYGVFFLLFAGTTVLLPALFELSVGAFDEVTFLSFFAFDRLTAWVIVAASLHLAAAVLLFVAAGLTPAKEKRAVNDTETE